VAIQTIEMENPCGPRSEHEKRVYQHEEVGCDRVTSMHQPHPDDERVSEAIMLVGSMPGRRSDFQGAISGQVHADAAPKAVSHQTRATVEWRNTQSLSRVMLSLREELERKRARLFSNMGREIVDPEYSVMATRANTNKGKSQLEPGCERRVRYARGATLGEEGVEWPMWALPCYPAGVFLEGLELERTQVQPR
jgi:hypothetical protein